MSLKLGQRIRVFKVVNSPYRDIKNGSMLGEIKSIGPLVKLANPLIALFKQEEIKHVATMVVKKLK